jgi:hypothetical protein
MKFWKPVHRLLMMSELTSLSTKMSHEALGNGKWPKGREGRRDCSCATHGITLNVHNIPLVLYGCEVRRCGNKDWVFVNRVPRRILDL